MQTASPEFTTLMNLPKSRPAKLRVTYGIIDTTIAQTGTITTTAGAPWSTPTALMQGGKLKNNYLSLDKNRFILGGGGEPIPTSNYKKTGFTSLEMSNSQGLFTVNPVITITTPLIKSIIGMSINFDEMDNSWCEFIVRTYNGNTLIQTMTIKPTSFRYVIEPPFDNWNKMQIEMTKTSYPYRHARVTKLDFGIYSKISNSEIASATWKNEISPISDKLPDDLFVVSIINTNKAFKPGQDEGIQKYFMQEQPISFDWGYDLDDGTEEWVTGGNYITTGKITFPLNLAVMEATNALLYCTDVYYKGTYGYKTLYELAEAILTEAYIPLTEDGDERWAIWEGLNNYYTYSALPKMPIRDLLKYIANASGCMLYCSRDGKIQIQPVNKTQLDVTIDYSKIVGANAEPTQNPPLYSVQVNAYTLNIEASSEIYKSTRTINGTETIFVEYSESTEIVVLITGGTLLGSEKYAYASVLTIIGNGEVTITITGKKIKRNVAVHEKQYGLTGQILPWDNPLCTSIECAERIATLVGDFYVKRTIYSAGYYGHVLLDPSDRIWFENDFSRKESGAIIENDIDFNGAWKGKLKWSR